MTIDTLNSEFQRGATRDMYTYHENGRSLGMDLEKHISENENGTFILADVLYVAATLHTITVTVYG